MCSVRTLAERVLDHIRRQELMHAGERVGVAVSGGIDSVALLRLLLELRGELGIVLSVVHFNHKLRGAESDGDEEFVANLAREYDLNFKSDSDDVAQYAAERRVSVETAARELRYGFFGHLLEGNEESPSGAEAPPLQQSPNRSATSAAPPKGRPDGAAENRASLKVDKVATGHTLDDQAETVLMRVMRGAGLRGLGGIYPRITIENQNKDVSGEIVRPLLTTRRLELEQYLKDIGQSWREDSSNADTSFLRNRVRKQIVPLLEREFNPAVVENLSDLAEIARAEEDYWENEIAGWMGTAVHWSEPEWARDAGFQSNLIQIQTAGSEPPRHARVDRAPWPLNATVNRLWFLAQPRAVQRRLAKAIAEQAGIPLELKHVDEILRFAADPESSGKELALPERWSVMYERQDIVFFPPNLGPDAGTQNYEYELPVPGRITVREIGSTFEALRIRSDQPGYNPENLLDAASLSGPLRVRNWRAGDRFWPAHTKSRKKIKELLQRQHAAPAERKLWPVVVSGDEIIWVRGVATPEKFRAANSADAILIREIFAGNEPER
jgi:tRNA(Ile)-lysidine synthase